MRLFDLILGGAGDLTTGAILLRLALVLCSIFATVHLISLWGTRYGDNNTLSKSFVLSLVLHGCFGLGWATVSDSYPHQSAGADHEPEQIPINFVGDVDSAPLNGTSNSPIWHSGPANSETSLTRDPRNVTRLGSDRTVDDIASPQTNQTPLTPLPQELPDFVSQTEEKAPDLDRSSDNTPMSSASAAMSADQPLSEARPEVTTKPSASRTNMTSLPTAAIEAPSRPEASRGTSSRLAPIPEEGTSVTFPTDYASDAPLKPVGLPSDETIRRPSSPSPAAVVDATAGTGPDTTDMVPGNTNSRRSDRTARSATRQGQGRDEISVRPSDGKKLSNDSNPSSGSAATDDRIITGGISTDTRDDSPQPKVDKPRSRGMSRAPARAPETYQARTSSQRMSNVLKNGGSEESEKAVESSLKWMSGIQESDGHWSSARYGGGSVEVDPNGQKRLDDGRFADTGVTGLVVLSFLGAGYSHEKGPYTAEIRNALDWLISQQDKDGHLGGRARKNYDQNYCHAIATFALGEAYAMQKEANEYPELRNAVKLGVRKISKMQNEDGGWRYSRYSKDSELDMKSDMSMFGWQLMALKSAVNGGIPVEEKTRLGMVRFLEEHSLGKSGGLAGYRKDDAPTPAMTAEALFCRQMFATRANDAASQEAVAYLRKNLPRVTKYDEYYWYYGTLAMRNTDEESWRKWNDALRDMLVSLQVKQGDMAGSWDPVGKWAGIGGRLYSTAISTMCLEVYYRYQLNNKPTDSQ